MTESGQSADRYAPGAFRDCPNIKAPQAGALAGARAATGTRASALAYPERILGYSERRSCEGALEFGGDVWRDEVADIAAELGDLFDE